MRIDTRYAKRFIWSVAGLVTVFVPTLCIPAHADNSKQTPSTGDVVAKAAAALYEGVREEVLPNGLHVYLKPVPESPIVTTMVAYRVGSADEDLDHTGLSLSRAPHVQGHREDHARRH